MNTTTRTHPLETIPPAGCERHLRTERIGRLAVNVDGHPEIFPINYVVDVKSRIVFRTDHGTKLAAVVHDNDVAFEIDGIDEQRKGGWSVLVVGTARWTRPQDIDEHVRLRLQPWAAGPKASYVVITPTKTTGRWINLFHEEG